MRIAASLLSLLLVTSACRESAPPATETVDAREPIGFWYVGAPELQVREKPDDAATVLATYQNGEGISVFAEQGDWVEVRTGAGSGWAKKTDLTNAEGKQQSEDNPEPKFRMMPSPISAPSAKGEIYIEADVNSDGEVTGVRVINNTTGSEALALQNAASLRNGKFHPLMQNGERKPFKYYHRVTY